MTLAIFSLVLLCAAGTAGAQTTPTLSIGAVSPVGGIEDTASPATGLTPDSSDGGETSSEPAGAPRIGVILEDLTLALDEPPAVVDLVAGLVGDVESYSAFSEDVTVVTVQVAGSMLTLIPVALGETSVSVSALNQRGTAYQEFGITVVARGAPEILMLIEEKVLTLGAPPVEVDITRAFSGGVLSYTATSDDPSLVAVQVSGSTVVLTGLAPGTTRIFASATGVSGVALQAVRVQVVEATPPVGAAPFTDQVLTVGDPPSVLDVSSAFSGDGLTYHAAASDGAVVVAEISASELSLAGLSTGVTTVSVTATNSSGAAVQSFQVTVHNWTNSETGRTGPVQENPTG